MKKQIQLLKGLNFSYYATTAILMPFLPLYFASKSFTAFQIGLLMMLGTCVAIFTQPICGYISDRFNTVKKVLLVIWACMLIASIGLFNSDTFLATLFFITLLYLFMMPTVPLLDSMSIKSAQQAGVSYGSLRLWGSIGFAIIALSGGFIILLLGGIENMKYAYWLLWLIPIILIVKVKDEPGIGAKVSFNKIKEVLGNRSFIWFMLLILLIGIPHRMNDTLLGIHMTDLGATHAMVGWAWALAAISEVPTFVLLSRYLHRYHELAMLSIVSFIYTVRWLVFAFINEPIWLMSLQISHSITFAALWIISLHYVTRVVPRELITTCQAILTATFMGVAGLLGGMGGGLIQDIWGGSAMYGTGAVLALAAGLLFLFTHVSNVRKQNKIELSTF